MSVTRGSVERRVVNAGRRRRRARTGRRGRLPSRLARAGAALVVVALVAVVVHVLPREPEPRSFEHRPITPEAFADLVDSVGITRDGAALTGDLDGAGNSLSAWTLAEAGWHPGGEVTVLGVPIDLPSYGDGRPDHLVCRGQLVALEEERVRSVAFLVTATRSDDLDAPVLGTGRVVYADGTEEEFTLSVPDWATGPAADAVLSLPYTNSTSLFGRGAVGGARLYARTVPVDPLREVSHVVLPRGPVGGDIQVFAVEGTPVGDDWVGTWSRATSALLEVGPWEDQTLRLVVRTSTGGTGARIRLDNTFADRAVTIGAASLALRGTGAGTEGAAVPLTFDGDSRAVIPAGGQLFSDPVAIGLPADTELLVSMYLPGHVRSAPVHYAAVDTGFTSAPGTGDRTLDTSGAPFTGFVTQWPFLTGVEVLGAPGAVVTVGDSITDGVGATRDAHARWPDVLSERLAAQDGIPHLGVLNTGVAGNQVVSDVYPGEGLAATAAGVSLRHRFPRDVLAQNGVDTVVVFAGINDLRWGVPARRVITGLEEIAVLGRERGLRVFVATLAPCGGERLCTSRVDRARQEVNAHLRAQATAPDSVYDGVWDFDLVLRDPADPTRLLPAYDSGDHLHPGDAGLRAIAESVDLYALVGG
ncbi:GDSL-type esterase/lipase family protein [Nocardiopsis sp. EMB25]|uniref:GDSL-type esterase/lipase family protein n=1 Tax=Nocardiopsis sp. EMB25 TaxID=2835867 RepID=UPI002284AC69|nr:GDSL-type esterase/lipase family protein [Nocardiopsis sp. EMB25]MCY9782793.1 GDSL-type esterase/lipase family protein [Nocardiopsis sp. EMB25]